MVAVGRDPQAVTMAAEAVVAVVVATTTARRRDPRMVLQVLLKDRAVARLMGAIRTLALRLRAQWMIVQADWLM